MMLIKLLLPKMPNARPQGRAHPSDNYIEKYARILR
jgi:hypothetical protein